jgi:ATP synthase protein I
MTNYKRPDSSKLHKEFCRQVGIKESRKIQAQKTNIKTIWYGLSMMGLIGWSVAIPTLLGIGAGIWLDQSFPIAQSWTLILMIIGMTIGCLNAWRWLAREEKKIREEQEKKDE